VYRSLLIVARKAFSIGCRLVNNGMTRERLMASSGEAVLGKGQKIVDVDKEKSYDKHGGLKSFHSAQFPIIQVSDILGSATVMARARWRCAEFELEKLYIMPANKIE
jgi:hypothetical protein